MRNHSEGLPDSLVSKTGRVLSRLGVVLQMVSILSSCSPQEDGKQGSVTDAFDTKLDELICSSGASPSSSGIVRQSDGSTLTIFFNDKTQQYNVLYTDVYIKKPILLDPRDVHILEQE